MLDDLIALRSGLIPLGLQWAKLKVINSHDTEIDRNMLTNNLNLFIKLGATAYIVK